MRTPTAPATSGRNWLQNLSRTAYILAILSLSCMPPREIAGIHPQAEAVGLSFLGSALVALVGYVFGSSRSKKLYLPNKIKSGTRKNTVLVVGRGATGKSSLIKIITSAFTDRKPERTDRFEIVSFVRNETNKKPVLFIFNDYRGQNFAQLIAGFVQAQLKPNTPLRYGSINSLVLMVDLFPFADGKDPEEKSDDLNANRIHEHINEWNTTALDAVFGLLTQKELTYVCLFINKIDKWSKGSSADAEQTIKDLFKPLIDDLRRRTGGGSTAFNVIVGSALKGNNVLGPRGCLMERLYHFSEPAEPEDSEGGR